MIRNIVFTLLFCFGVHLYSQNVITGAVFDMADQPLAFANVLLLKRKDSTLMAGAMSDEKGLFRLESDQEGVFIIRVTSLGYSEYTSDEYVLDGNTSITIVEPIILKEDAQQLAEVELVARRNLYERRPDRMVVNVQSSSINAGGSALSILETSPGVTVNRANGIIGMLGREGAAIYINGKRTRMLGNALVQMLEGLPSSSIEKLELITNPPANFDAEGTGGAINIVLKSGYSKKGWSGSVTGNSGYGNDFKYGATTELYFAKENYSFFTSFNNNQNFSIQPNFIDKRYVLNGATFQEILNGHREAFIGANQFRIGGEIELQSETSLGAEIKFRRNVWNLDALSKTVGTENQDVLFTEDLVSYEINNWNHLLTSFYFKQQLGKESSLGIEYDYLNYTNINDADYDEMRMENNTNLSRSFISEAETDVAFHVARFDFDTALWDKGKLGIGAKGTISKFNNEVAVFDTSSGIQVPDEELSQIRKLDERIWAAYVEINLDLGEKTDLNAGIRYEYTDSNLNTVGEQNDYVINRGQYFPSIRLSHRFNTNWNTSFSYGERIGRPDFRTLSPAFYFFNSTTLYTGNPAIRPVTSRTLSYSLEHKRKHLTLQYTSEANPNAWRAPSFSEDFSTTTINPQPMEERRLLSATLAFPFRITKRLTSNHSLSGLWQYEVPIYEDIPLERSNWYINLSSNFQYQLSNALSSDVSFNWISPRIIGLSDSEAAIGLNLGASYNITERWQLSYSLMDAFDRNTFLHFDSEIPENNARLNWFYHYEGRIHSVALRYKFGNGSKRKERGYGSQEEQNRLN